MKKKLISVILCAAMMLTLFSGCAKKSNTSETTEQSQAVVTKESSNDDDNAAAAGEAVTGDIKTLDRPSLAGDFEAGEYDAGLVPEVTPYSTDAALSNVINAEDVAGADYTTEAFREKLAQNLFVVGDSIGYEFWENYEFNVYSQTPNFVTVDSLMHTYHLYFSHLLKTIEKTCLSDAVKTISLAMYEKSLAMYDEYAGTDWEEAAKKNVEYFAVACSLIGAGADVPDYAADAVSAELSNIMNASEITVSNIVTDLQEDYSQYKPRGYYENDEQLSEYFRTMMWFGRITFDANNEDNTRAAVLMSIALKDTALEKWESVYAVTSFFAGASDDFGYCEYMPAIEAVYGENPDKDKLVNDDAAWDSFVKTVAKMDPPQIQSIPVYEDEENVIPGFRLMGQRFTIDANIMQNLIYRNVEENENGERRMLPSVLDVPAALGSDKALSIVRDNGASAFPDYDEKMEEQREELDNAPESIWTSSLYAQWLNTLRPLLSEKSEGYPSFMQNEEWTKKTLETFAGSYTELKHDTILYGKQPMAEMGGGDMPDVDDRGYVEPEPLVYARFSNLASATAKGLEDYGMISSDDKENLELLAELSDKLLVISQKELKNELPTDEEFELIRNYGGNLEHFWYDAMRSETDEEFFTTEEYPAGLVVDVATDPNGTVLEAGTGNPREIYVIVPVDGILRIATGSVYDFYEFEWPLSDRLTDTEWREKIGAEPGAGYLYTPDDSIKKPEWTQSYYEEKWNW